MISALVEDFFVEASGVAEERVIDRMYQFVVITWNRLGNFSRERFWLFLAQRCKEIFSDEESHLGTRAEVLMSVRRFADSVELNAIIGESITDVVAPVLELGSCPLKLVIIVAKVSRLEVEKNIEIAVWCGENCNFRFDYSENMERNLFENVWKNMFDPENNKVKLGFD